MNGEASGSQSPGPSTSLLTEQNVRDRLSRGIFLGKIHTNGRPTVAQIVLTTIRELDRACGERYFEANYPADLPIWYVEPSGTFTVIAPRFAASPRKSDTNSSAFII
jgi:hypothetical protein